MIKILLSGCNGKMGQVISRLAQQFSNLKIVAGYDLVDTQKNEYPVYTNIKDCNIAVDVIIDFSNPSALINLLEYSISKKIPLVMATTGLSDIQISKLKKHQSNSIFQSANMSLGVNLLLDLVKSY